MMSIKCLLRYKPSLLRSLKIAFVIVGQPGYFTSELVRVTGRLQRQQVLPKLRKISTRLLGVTIRKSQFHTSYRENLKSQSVHISYSLTEKWTCTFPFGFPFVSDFFPHRQSVINLLYLEHKCSFSGKDLQLAAAEDDRNLPSVLSSFYAPAYKQQQYQIPQCGFPTRFRSTYTLVVGAFVKTEAAKVGKKHLFANNGLTIHPPRVKAPE